MSFLRLATNCAVLDDQNRILLSRRGDLNVWNLPGGRLDSGESISEAAAREVREETGVVCQIERAVGLYYMAGWNRLQILYAGKPIGGKIFQESYETRENRYFAQTEFPSGLWDTGMIRDSFSDVRPMPTIIETPPDELRRTMWKLRLRWITNLLRGRPEPRHVRFNLHAVAILFDRSLRRVLTLPDGNFQRLPRVRCDGSAPWEQLSKSLRHYGEMSFQWVGLWQDTHADSIDFIFAATIRETENALWSNVQNSALTGNDAEYVRLTTSDYRTAPVWTLYPATSPLDTINS